MMLPSTLRLGVCCGSTARRWLSKTATSWVAKRKPAVSASAPNVAIVGAGPSGFYVAQFLQKSIPGLCVTLFEKLPVPYGLARYGVAPDHPEVKNCTTQFEAVALNPNTSMFSNITIGDLQNDADASVSELQSAFDAVVLSHGSAADRKLSIEGADLQNIFDAGAFVGWYNGDPAHVDLDVDFSGKHAVIIGQGNVALDCARLLSCPFEHIQPTDITSESANQLAAASFNEVHLVGRRGPIEAAFTTKEMRELSRIQDVECVITPEDIMKFSSEEKEFVNASRPLKRKMKLLEGFAKVSDKEYKHLVSLDFLLSPSSFQPKIDSDAVGSVVFDVMKLEGSLEEGRKAVKTGDSIEIMADLVISSIGRQGFSIDSSIPFNEKKNQVENVDGRVTGVDGVYCSGWIKNGPMGTIAKTLSDAQHTAAIIVEDLKMKVTEQADWDVSAEEKATNRSTLFQRLEEKALSFDQWKKIEAEEIRQGELSEKVAEKFTSIDKMLEVARQG